MKRSAATLVIVGSSLFLLVSGVAAVLVVSVAVSSLTPLTATVPTAAPASAPGPPASPAPAPTGGPPSVGSRLADYTFGHTAGALPSGGPGVSVDITERIPFVLGEGVESLRLHARNWSYIDDRPLPGTVNVSGIALGRAEAGAIPGDSSAFAGPPVALSTGATLTDGTEYVSDWVDSDATGLRPGVPSLLSLGFSTRAGTLVGVAADVAWLQATADPASVTAQQSVGAFTMTGSFLDLWLEYTYSSPGTLIVVAGHSLNSGANGDSAEHPHNGESSAWHQLWAERYDGVAASLSTPGSSTGQFAPDSAKWNAYPGLDPDAFVLWSASNDLAAGESLEVLKAAWMSTLSKAQQLWPKATVFAFTEPGRGLTGQQELDRQLWNDWLRSDASGAFTVVDADAVLSDPADPAVLNPSLDGDGAHPTPAGNALVADAFECALGGC